MLHDIVQAALKVVLKNPSTNIHYVKLELRCLLTSKHKVYRYFNEKFHPKYIYGSSSLT